MLSSRLHLLPRELSVYAVLSPARRTMVSPSTLVAAGRLLGHPPSLSRYPRPSPISVTVNLARHQQRSMHVSSPRPGLPFIVPFLGLLKSSAALTGVTVIARVAATLLVFSRVYVARKMGIKDPKSPRYMPRPPRVSWQAWRRHWETWPGVARVRTGPRPPPGRPLPITGRADVTQQVADEVELLRDWQEIIDRSGRGLEWVRTVMKTLMWGPVFALLVVLLAGLEQTPVTGRWRLVLISPAEEEVIHRALVDKGWFEAVLDLLMSPTIDVDGQDVRTPPQILPDTDWRWAWVESTLRRLESGVIAAHDSTIAGSPTPASKAAFPHPPPSTHPLHPRPRASLFLHDSLPHPSDESISTPSSVATTVPHVEGPPFQLLLLESSEPNAFSYGFGGNGASGIVMNTGMLDQILSTPSSSPVDIPPQSTSPPPTSSPPRSLLSYFLPTAATSPPKSSTRAPRSVPTEEQTLHLATVLSHEMSHLLLSHHLETLSATSILIPALVNLGGDLVRVMLFPLTMLFGPFVNDFVASATRPDPKGIASRAISESCSSIKLELEADEVALRILANSNLNPFEASRFWTPDHPPSPSHLDGLTRAADVSSEREREGMMAWLRLGGGGRSKGSHPTGEERKKAVEKELNRWVAAAAAKEKEKAQGK